MNDELRTTEANKLVGWRGLIDQAHELNRHRQVNQPMPNPVEVLRELRDERDASYDLD